VQISERTVRRRLKQVELGSYIPAKAPKLEIRHRVSRLAFGHENVNWNIDQWSQVLFTGRKSFLCKHNRREGKNMATSKRTIFPM
jgi:hypothetical protein